MKHLVVGMECVCVCVGGTVNAWHYLATQLQTFLTLDGSYIVAVIEKRYRARIKTKQ